MCPEHLEPVREAIRLTKSVLQHQHVIVDPELADIVIELVQSLPGCPYALIFFLALTGDSEENETLPCPAGRWTRICSTIPALMHFFTRTMRSILSLSRILPLK